MNDSTNQPDRLDGGATVEQIVANYPATHLVFVDLGLDTCCGGKKPLRKACEDIGADYARVLERLERAAELDGRRLARG